MSNNGGDSYDKINDFNAVKISLADPKKIREESKGEVRKPETVNYRSYKPEKEGLFCERIFGPEKDWECSCGKFRGMKYKGMTCDRCGVKITHSRVRRKRMGHIELAAPVVHIWFFRASTSRLATLLAMKSNQLEKVVYFQDYVVVDRGETPLKEGQLLTEEEYRKYRVEYGDNAFKADMGAEAVRELLKRLNVVELSKKLRDELAETKSKQRRKELISRLRLVEALRSCKYENNPEWMVLETIPVIPPDLRPLVLLESGTFATSDLNDLYRRIINRNNRLKKLTELNAPEVIIRNEKRMLQQSVDALFDNMRCKRPVLGSSNRPLKSLTDMIKGKQGRFRENLLGKRVDYSARSVIVVGPHLRLHQCGIPKPIALELYQPFIIRKLKERGLADTIKSAKKMLERRDDEVWDILEEVILNHPVLLNRAPTLHRMSIQAFEPILVEGNAIKLHPLVCKGFNADFDGDQMAVHLPLSLEAQVEAHTLMLSTNNIFSPASGKPIISPSQDIVMGCYFITLQQPNMPGEGMKFASFDECMLAFSLGKVHLQAKIYARLPQGRFLKSTDSDYNKERGLVENENGGVGEGRLIQTSPGRIIFNQIVGDGPYYDLPLGSKELQVVISDCYEANGRKATIELLDKMMRLGFEESTKSGLSFAADDLITPPEKKSLLEDGDRRVQRILDEADQGALSEDVRYNRTIDIWGEVNKAITEKMMESFKNDVYMTDEEFARRPSVKRRPFGYVNPVYLMAFSGARGGTEQIRQLAGMRGLMAKPNGKIIESPVKANFLEGLTVLEYFSSTHGARKGLSDTALKTSDSGYLTRKLADVAQNCVVTMHDCGTERGVVKSSIAVGDRKIPLSQSIVGRVACQNVADPTRDDQPIVRKGELITIDIARKIDALGTERLRVRSPMTCEAKLGVCALCYGMDLSTSQLVEEGMAVGIIAAQSIGEPGTQLTMRTFHIGGAASHDVADNEIKTKYAGIVRFDKMDVVEDKRSKCRRVLGCRPDGGVAICNSRGQYREIYRVPEGAELRVAEGDAVEVGDVLASFEPHNKLIIAKSEGVIQFEDIVENETVQTEMDKNDSRSFLTVLELKGDRRPSLSIIDKRGGKQNESYQLSSKSTILVKDGDYVVRGDVLAKVPQSASGTHDITNGLPRVTEIFEARSPKEPAVIAQVSGIVEIAEKRSHGKRIINIKYPDPREPNAFLECPHEIPQGKRIRVITGDEILAGQPLTDGQLVPKDILRVSGPEAIQDYLVQEVQAVYRSQGVSINDKHIEIIISQMLRKMKVDDGGDTSLLAGDLVDKFEFERRNNELRDCVKVATPGHTDFIVGEVVTKEEFTKVNEELAARFPDFIPATSTEPRCARGSLQLLGITKAAVQSDSFLSAASFQETTKVLTEAALSYKIDRLVGLKENVILGRLIPAGTGFKLYRDARWDHLHGADVDDGYPARYESYGDYGSISKDVDGSPAFPITPNETDSFHRDEEQMWSQDDVALDGRDAPGYFDERYDSPYRYDDRRDDGRGFPGERYDDRGFDDRGFDDRGFVDPRFNDPRFNDDRGFDDPRGFDDRGFDDPRGFDDRGFDDPRFSDPERLDNPDEFDDTLRFNSVDDVYYDDDEDGDKPRRLDDDV